MNLNSMCRNRELGVVVLMSALLFFPYWLQGDVFGTFDLAHITIPLEQLFARYQARGELPVWVGEFTGGFPLMANGFQSFFYLPHLVLRALLPAVWAINLSLWLHVMLAAFGMWLLLKQYKLSATAAAVGALLFSIGGYFAGRVTLPHLFFPAAWVPLVIWAAARIWHKPTLSRAAILAVVGANLILAGHIQMALYGALMVVIAVVVWFISSAGRPSCLPRRLAVMIGAGVMMGLLTAVHVLPLSEHLPLSRRGQPQDETEAYDVSYPVWHMLTVIHPGVFGLKEQYKGAKNEPELMAYVGTSGLVLGLFGLLSPRFWRSRLGWVAVAWGVVGVALAGGGYSPFYRWVHELPTPLAGLANPGRALFLAFSAWVIAAAFGADWLLSNNKGGRGQRWTATMAVTALFCLQAYTAISSVGAREAVVHNAPSIFSLMLVVAVALGLLSWAPATKVRAWGLLSVMTIELLILFHATTAPVPARFFTAPLLLEKYLPASTLAPRTYSQRAIEPVPFGDFGITPGLTVTREEAVMQSLQAQANHWQSAVVDLTWNVHQPSAGSVRLEVLDADHKPIRQAQVEGMDIQPDQPVLFTFDPIVDSAGKTYRLRFTSTYPRAIAPYLYIRSNPGRVDFNPTGVAMQCRGEVCEEIKNTDWQTIADLSVLPSYGGPARYLARELLIPMFGEGEGYYMVRAHLTLQWQRYDAYMRVLGERGNFYAGDLIVHRDMVDRLAAGTILTSFPSYRTLPGMPDTTLVGRALLGDRELQVYRNETAYPRIQLADQVVVAAAPQAQALLYQAKLKPQEVVVEDLAVPAGVGDDKKALVQLVSDTGQRLSLQVESVSPQLLVLRDVNLPGWSVTVDGRPSSIGTVDTLFRGVVVPAGKHVVKFFYKSPRLRQGLWLSGVTWLSIIIVGLWSFLRPHLRKNH